MSTITKGLVGEQDMSLYDGTNSTFTRTTSTGGTNTYSRVGAGTWTLANLNLVNVLNGTATGATAGTNTLPASPVGFIVININGAAKKIPFYNP